jgi:hypothetical protein
MSDYSGDNLLAPVAEYKGIAIVERAGAIRASWRGKEYFTDGLSYLMGRPKDGERVTLIGLPNEFVCKQFIDERSADELRHFCSYGEAYLIICKVKPTVTPTYHWDDIQSVFIPD